MACVISPRRGTLDARELGPLDVPDDGNPHGNQSHISAATRVDMAMMENMLHHPFERFYLEQRDGVFAHLRRLLGSQGAEDAFQETFLRALRAYPRLKHTDNLRAWVLTIATNVAVDDRRRLRPVAAEVPEIATVDEPLAFEELRELTAALPPTERVAVFLRYGYDPCLDQIGAALGSSPDAARQAASSWRSPAAQEGGDSMTVPTDLDRRFREAAGREKGSST